MRQLSHIPGINTSLMDPKSLCPLLLFGSTNLAVVENRIVLEATMAYMKAIKRFSKGDSAFCCCECGESFSGGDLWGVDSSCGFALECDITLNVLCHFSSAWSYSLGD